MRLFPRPTAPDPATETARALLDARSDVLDALIASGRTDAERLLTDLLDTHRLHLGELLYVEADRYTPGGFADGIRFGASCVKHPEKFIAVSSASPADTTTA